MSSLVWLASYPKSGNTWVRAFTAAYLGKDDDRFDLNRLDQSLHAASRVLFERVTGLYASELLPNEVDRLRPAVYRCLGDESSWPQLFKVHDRWRLNDAGLPVFPGDASRCAILIVRNPLAIVASYASHYGLSLDESIAQLGDEQLELSRSETGLKPQLNQPVGSWSSHTLSWLDQREIPVHLVRYEELRANPFAGFSALLAAAGLEVDPRRIHKAIEQTRFDRLQAAEAASGFSERRHNSARFFRRGEVDGWREELSPAQRHRVVAQHREVMRRLGYDVDLPE